MKVTSRLAVLASLILPGFAEPPVKSDLVDEMVFVSCFKETLPAPALETIAGLEPDVFIWMGDNVYGDTEDMEVMWNKYRVAREHPGYAKIRAISQVTGTWDDHDYGANDAGREYPKRAESQQVFLDFLDVPANSPRRKREGVYSVEDYGPPGQMVRVILLDTRYFRDPVGSDGAMLGDSQWQWLEKMLTGSEARVNVLVSSIQVLASEHRWEKWENFPKEKQRLLELLARKDVPPVLILSGDRHVAEISLDRESVGYPLYDITSSSLNLPLGDGDEPNRYREGRMFRGANFGALSIDWSREEPVITASIRDEQGRPQRAVSFELVR
ncbi:alkaline phosphatase D family protein [Haloferula sp. A504]|uniref:alkaline phosphatase D family protein n=1 Tax=Haloferula sp. A504 TaxID=3373601 RepID=UPI0031C8D0C6|nr:alkaline phosphatase family protein [Verrucomicrobiaceae bacterium E54]